MDRLMDCPRLCTQETVTLVYLEIGVERSARPDHDANLSLCFVSSVSPESSLLF
jgi:hypothetical protein